jgi:histidine phosphotransfer protein HptB
MPSQTVIDLPTFEALRESMGADYLPELVQAYAEETPQLLAKLRQALADGDCEAFRIAAHSIKSTSNSFGALQFGALAKELELMGREARLDQAVAKVETLAADFAGVQKTLEVLCHD